MEAFMGLLIPIMIFAIPLLAIWTKHQQKMAEKQMTSAAHSTAEKAAQYASRVKELEDRVRVLERIVTDRGYDIATQIEALRDTRETDERNAGVQLDFAQKESV